MSVTKSVTVFLCRKIVTVFGDDHQQIFSKSFLHENGRFKNDNKSLQFATEREKNEKNNFSYYINII